MHFCWQQWNFYRNADVKLCFNLQIWLHITIIITSSFLLSDSAFCHRINLSYSGAAFRNKRPFSKASFEPLEIQILDFLVKWLKFQLHFGNHARASAILREVIEIDAVRSKGLMVRNFSVPRTLKYWWVFLQKEKVCSAGKSCFCITMKKSFQAEALHFLPPERKKALVSVASGSVAYKRLREC